MNNRDIILSIIIPTYGRVKELECLLKSICNIEITIDYEIIIVDQNDDGKIDFIINKYSKYINIVHEKVNFQGISKARNYGFILSKGKFICYPDDDAEFLDTTISNALSILKNTKADCVSGKLIDKKLGKDAMFSFPKKQKILSLDNMENSFIEPAMYYKREFLLEYPFDEKMGIGTIHGAQEGYDQIFRALIDKKLIIYDPRIIYYHPMKKGERNTEAEIHRAFYYSCGLGYLCKKHSIKTKFIKRFVKLSCALPFIALFRHKQFKYFFAQWMGILLGYKYI